MNDLSQQSSFIHDGVEPDSETGATQTPIYQSAGFAHNNAQDLEDVFQGKAFGYYYSRVNNPTVVALEKRLTALEKGLGAVVVSSGMAAITTAITALACSGDNIVVGKSLFGSTYYLLKGLITDMGIDVRFVDSCDSKAFEDNIDKKTRLLYVEAMGNPKLDVPNLQTLSTYANQHNIPLVLDTTLTTTYMLDAKQHGAHIVVCATTKYICGGGTTVGGVVIDIGTMKWSKSPSKTVQEMSKFGQLAFLSAARKVRSNVGNCQSPFNAFLTQLGIDTLGLRMKQHGENALALAEFFETHSNVNHVNYLGLSSHSQHVLASKQFNHIFGGLLTIRVGSKENAFKLINNLKMVKDLVNIGDAKTLAVYPASTIYRNLNKQERESAGVYEDMIRISVGLEDKDDIINDFKQALESIR
ncbi:aminotransferase class I/II-fold pyridoxal phosphate-dependent enzyme [bacterium]|nr:aminotransferase class I/II-fold pyridoxal phosphate-dependent enzyme [bacterium]